MRSPQDYARRAVANWVPAPSPRCLADLEAMAREILADAAAEALAMRGKGGLRGVATAAGYDLACEDLHVLLRRAAGREG